MEPALSLLPQASTAARGETFDVAGHQVSARASVGISIYPYDAMDERTLMKHADAAMYEAKRRGEGGSFHAGRAS